jgi:hypothetical protein
VRAWPLTPLRCVRGSARTDTTSGRVYQTSGRFSLPPLLQAGRGRTLLHPLSLCAVISAGAFSAERAASHDGNETPPGHLPWRHRTLSHGFLALHPPASSPATKARTEFAHSAHSNPAGAWLLPMLSQPTRCQTACLQTLCPRRQRTGQPREGKRRSDRSRRKVLDTGVSIWSVVGQWTRSRWP